MNVNVTVKHVNDPFKQKRSALILDRFHCKNTQLICGKSRYITQRHGRIISIMVNHLETMLIMGLIEDSQEIKEFTLINSCNLFKVCIKEHVSKSHRSLEYIL